MLVLTNMVRGFSSAGRAPALQAGGQRFEPAKLHHIVSALPARFEADFSRDEDNSFPCFRVRDLADLPPFFDIVNGFFNRCRGGIVRWL
jgi:hypothetical protein